MFMGKGAVVTTFKIMPDSVKTNLDNVEKQIKEKIKPSKLERLPIAFGLNAIIIVKVIEEEEGELDRITEELKSISGVREVEVTNVARSW